MEGIMYDIVRSVTTDNETEHETANSEITGTVDRVQIYLVPRCKCFETLAREHTFFD